MTQQEEKTEAKPLSKTKARALQTQATMEWFKKTWPEVFSSQSKPLTVGIDQAILPVAEQQSVDIAAVHRALATWCSSISYLRSVVENTHRIHLDGSQAEPITDLDREYAARKIREKKDRWKQKKQAQKHQMELERAAKERKKASGKKEKEQPKTPPKTTAKQAAHPAPTASVPPRPKLSLKRRKSTDHTPQSDSLASGSQA